MSEGDWVHIWVGLYPDDQILGRFHQLKRPSLLFLKLNEKIENLWIKLILFPKQHILLQMQFYIQCQGVQSSWEASWGPRFRTLAHTWRLALATSLFFFTKLPARADGSLYSRHLSVSFLPSSLLSRGADGMSAKQLLKSHPQLCRHKLFLAPQSLSSHISEAAHYHSAERNLSWGTGAEAGWWSEGVGGKARINSKKTRRGVPTFPLGISTWDSALAAAPRSASVKALLSFVTSSFRSWRKGAQTLESREKNGTWNLKVSSHTWARNWTRFKSFSLILFLPFKLFQSPFLCFLTRTT